MLNVFVKRDNLFEIKVFVYEQDGDLVVVDSVDNVPAGVDPETLKFSFRHPNHSDSTFITSQSVTVGEEGLKGFDFVKLQDLAFRRLLEKWNLTEEEGKEVPITSRSIDNLHPDIARTVAQGLVGRIKI